MSNLISRYLDKNGSDKCKTHTYHYIYDGFFASYDRNASLDILESGIEYGGSLSAWKEYFPNANVTGIDIEDKRLEQYKRDDVTFVLSDIKKYKPDREFDVIIEDGNHSNFDAMWSAINMSHWLKMNGTLFIEDVQEAYMAAFLLWGKLNGDFALSTIDLRRITNTHDNFLIQIQKIKVFRKNG